MDPLTVTGLVGAAGAIGAGLTKLADFLITKRKGLRRDSIDELSEHLEMVKKGHEEERKQMKEDITKLRFDHDKEKKECEERIDKLQREVIDHSVKLGSMRYHIGWVDKLLKKYDPNHVEYVDMSGTHTPLQS